MAFLRVLWVEVSREGWGFGRGGSRELKALGLGIRKHWVECVRM